MTIVMEALKLLPSKTDTHGLEGIGEYLQQVQDLLSDSSRAADSAVVPTLEDEVATAVDDLTEDVVGATSSKDESVAVIESSLDEVGATGDAGSSAMQKSQDASATGGAGQNTASGQPAGAPLEGGDDSEGLVQDQGSADRSTPPDNVVSSEIENVPAPSTSDSEV